MPDSSLAALNIPELRTPFVFRMRPVTIPADLRPAWRIGLIVLLLRNCCRQRRTSLTRLHVLSWGFRTSDGREQLLAAANGYLPPDALMVRFEPFLNQAVDYALGEALIRREGGNRIELTDKGLLLADELEGAADAFATEKALMHELRTRVTEDLVNRMFGWRHHA